MPLYEVRLKATEPFLGNKRCPPNRPGEKPVRRFTRKGDDLALDLAQWSWAISEAAEALHIADIDPNSIRFPVSMARPKLILYTRKWHHLGRKQEEFFESIQEGAELTVEVLLTKVSEDENKRPPTEEEFMKIMQFIGKMIGLSPWGSRFGYGRFKVLSLTPQ